METHKIAKFKKEAVRCLRLRSVHFISGKLAIVRMPATPCLKGRHDVFAGKTV